MRKIFSTLSFFLVMATAMALPVKRGQWHTLKLADGTEVRAELKGDEFSAYYEAADGRLFALGADNRYQPTDLAKLRAAAAPMRQKAQNQRADRNMARLPIGSDHDVYSGKKRGLVILVDFTNKKFEAGHDREFFDRFANEEGFSEGNFKGSVSDYFKAQSYGDFELEFDVVGPVHMKQRYGFYGGPTADGQNDNIYNVSKMVVDACEAIDDEVDFSQYDWDGNGEVDQVFIIYAGHGQADTDDVNTIWPHAFNVRDYGKFTPVHDGVTIFAYACSCELNGAGDAFGIGAMCHEFSHCLGLPDTYDTWGGESYGLMSWDLMDYGCYNANAYAPAGYTSYERMYAGWLKPTVLTEDCQVDAMKNLNDHPEAYIMYNDANPNEYYLLENRQRTGWDAGLAGDGLLVLHVDFDATAWRSNVVNSPMGQEYFKVPVHDRCTLIAADNHYGHSLESVAGDAYPYGENTQLTNESTPGAFVYNKNTDGSNYMNKQLTDIARNADGTIAFKFVNSAETSGIDTPTLNPAEQKAYSIDGRRVSSATQSLKHGVYIVNGRKLVK